MPTSLLKQIARAPFFAAAALALNLNAALAENSSPPSTDPVSLQSYDAVCRLVQARFFDPTFNGVDWTDLCAVNREQARALSQEDLAALLNGMLARLRTSHTRVYTPEDPAYYLLFDIFAQSPNLNDAALERFSDGRVEVEGIGIFTRQIDGRTFIEDIVEGTPADDADLLVGDELVAADGVPFHPVGAFAGKTGQQVRLDIRRQAGGDPTSVDVAVASLNPTDMFARGMETSARVIGRGDHRIGYVRIWSSAGEVYETILRDLVESGPLAEADALIVDLRGRIGGGGLNYLEILDPRGPQLTGRGRDFSQSSPASFRERTVWLIDAGVRSGAELLAYTIQQDGYGLLVGETTAGAVVGGSPFVLPDGSLLYLAVVDLEVDGRRLEGIGIAPDIEVPFALPYAAGSDPQLDRAIAEAARLGAP